MTSKEARLEGAERLTQAGCAAPFLDATLLLSQALGCRKEDLLTHPEITLSSAALAQYRALIEQRASGTCVAVITGTKEFRSLVFQVSADVLVPRPDTEVLVEAALAVLDQRPPAAPAKVLDLCTGSGCVAISLKTERPQAHMAASDISLAALALAQANARRLWPGQAATCPIFFYESDLFENISGNFDLIVSNPPYIPSGDIPLLAIEVRREPQLALDGGRDGLAVIRRLVPQAFCHLNPGGALLLEIGCNQAENVRNLMADAGFTNLCSYQDLSGIERVVGGNRP